MNTTPLKARIDFSQVDLVSDCLKVLSNPDRLKILCVLVEGVATVNCAKKQSDCLDTTGR